MHKCDDMQKKYQDLMEELMITKKELALEKKKNA